MKWPNYRQQVLTKHSYGEEDAASNGLPLSTAVSSTYLTANHAYFAAFWLPSPTIIAQLFCYNGAAVSGNVDVGIYTKDGTRIISAGSTAQAGTNALQAFNVADTLVGPGEYLMAIALDNTTGTFFRLATGNRSLRPLGWFLQGTAFSLPATATLAAYVSSNYMPIFGFTTRSVL